MYFLKMGALEVKIYAPKQIIKRSAIPIAPLEFFSFINCSDGAATPKGLMTYGTKKRRSESDMPTTEYKRPASSCQTQKRIKFFSQDIYAALFFSILFLFLQATYIVSIQFHNCPFF